MPMVLNKYTDVIPSDAINIMRPSKWGNPFHLHTPEARDEALHTYELWASKQEWLIAAAKRELRGRDLVCCCKPKRCHGDWLLRIANEQSFAPVGVVGTGAI